MVNLSQNGGISTNIGQHDLLIDSGSTHNFIRMASLLKLPVIPTTPFNINVANGRSLKCQGIFETIQMLLQSIPFSFTLYVLPLMALDVVLGLLGKIGVNSMQMEIVNYRISIEWKDS